MAIYELDGVAPQLAEGAWVADSAQVMGNVELARERQRLVRRGAARRHRDDPHRAQQQRAGPVGAACRPRLPLTIGENVTVGHQVMLHGCTIGDNSLIGIQAVVLNNAKIGRNCHRRRRRVVTEGKEFPDNSLIIGIAGQGGAHARRRRQIARLKQSRRSTTWKTPGASRPRGLKKIALNSGREMRV